MALFHYLALMLRYEEGKGVLMTTTTTLTCATTIQEGVVGSSRDGCGSLSWFHFGCNYYAAPGENFKSKACERICRGNYSCTNFPLKCIKVFVSTLWIAPIVQDNSSTLTTIAVVVCTPEEKTNSTTCLQLLRFLCGAVNMK